MEENKMPQGKRFISGKKKGTVLEIKYDNNSNGLVDKNYNKKMETGWDEYYLASMFPSDAIMHKVYSIIRKRNQKADNLQRNR